MNFRMTPTCALIDGVATHLCPEEGSGAPPPG